MIRSVARPAGNVLIAWCCSAIYDKVRATGRLAADGRTRWTGAWRPRRFRAPHRDQGTPAHVILSAERIRLDANPGSKDEAIRQAAQLLVDTGAIAPA